MFVEVFIYQYGHGLYFCWMGDNLVDRIRWQLYNQYECAIACEARKFIDNTGIV